MSIVGSEQRLTLPDGRIVSFADQGRQVDPVVLYCHGFAGCRYEAQILGPMLNAYNVRLVAIDRPGYGHSSRDRHHSLQSWVADARVLLNHLNIAHCRVLGVSGGAPYALAFAYAAAHMVGRVAIVGGLGPPVAITANRQAFIPAVRAAWDCAARHPRAVAPLAWLVVSLLRLRLAVGARIGIAGGHDAAILADDRIQTILRQSQIEGLRTGGEGARDDLRLYVRPWGFTLTSIDAPVDVWHGRADRVVPVAIGEFIVRALPQGQPHFVAGEGHYSLPVRYAAEIITALLADHRGVSP